MGTIGNKLEMLSQTKAAIRAAIIEKGQSVGEEEPFSAYPEKIRAIADEGWGTPPDPAKVYQQTRPKDWLPMPEASVDEMYLLFHIPAGGSSLLAFTVECAGNYTVELGTVKDGAFAASSSSPVASGKPYEAELFADDWGDLTTDGMKQVMVRVSGTDILTWAPSTHSKKTFPDPFISWNIAEILCRLPKGTRVECGCGASSEGLTKLRYFSWEGENAVTDMSGMFSQCCSLVAILQLNAANVTNMSNMFEGCYALAAITELDTSHVTAMGYMFYGCSFLTAIPRLDTSHVTDMDNMFDMCTSLITIPELDTSNVTYMRSMFNCCYVLAAIPELDTSNMTAADNMFDSCYSLSSLTLNPAVTGWAGDKLPLSGCALDHKAIVNLFNSLPTITAAKMIFLTGNPGVSELTEEEKAIATGKNWTLKL